MDPDAFISSVACRPGTPRKGLPWMMVARITMTRQSRRQSVREPPEGQLQLQVGG